MSASHFFNHHFLRIKKPRKNCIWHKHEHIFFLPSLTFFNWQEFDLLYICLYRQTIVDCIVNKKGFLISISEKLAKVNLIFGARRMSSYNNEIKRKLFWINIKNLKFATFGVNYVHILNCISLVHIVVCFVQRFSSNPFFSQPNSPCKKYFFPFFSISKVKKSKGWVNVNTNRQKNVHFY